MRMGWHSLSVLRRALVILFAPRSVFYSSCQRINLTNHIRVSLISSPGRTLYILQDKAELTAYLCLSTQCSYCTHSGKRQSQTYKYRYILYALIIYLDVLCYKTNLITRPVISIVPSTPLILEQQYLIIGLKG